VAVAVADGEVVAGADAEGLAGVVACGAQATATKAMRMARNCGGVFIFRQRQIGDGCAPYHGGNPGFRRSHRFSPYIKQFSGTFLGLAPLGIGKSPEIGMAP